ncbi:MAG: DUF6668 family protein [Schaalia turicensis]
MSEPFNPWATPDEDSHQEAEVAPACPHSVAVSSWGVQAGVPVPETALLESHYCEPLGRVGVVGLHGGAGTTTLANLTGLVDCGHVWPTSFPDANTVICVARTHMSGLHAARRAAAEVFSGAVSGIHVLGCVLVADAPGKRLPRPLAEACRLVRGAFPRVWTLEFSSALRVGETPSRFPRTFAHTITELSELTVERKH